MCQDNVAGIEVVVVAPDASCGLWVTEAGKQALAEARWARTGQGCADGIHCETEAETLVLPVGRDDARCEMLEWPLAALLRQLAGFDRSRADLERELQDAINYMTNDQLTVLQKISEVLLGWG